MKIKRDLLTSLNIWKRASERQPLILKGARQVGKTFLVDTFSETFSNYFKFNFQKDRNLHPIFENSSNPKVLIEKLGIYVQKKIDIGKDLIFFDEIQDCPAALNSLKFFAEDFPEAYIIGAGSLLGIYLSRYSFPVGKVQFETLYPISFFEYLEAKQQLSLAEKLRDFQIEKEDSSKIEFINSFHEKLIEELREYFVIGGMPKVVSTFLKTANHMQAREIQLDLLTSYKADFSKYSGPVDALKILSVFENIPKQLAKDNRKFQFNLLKKGARYSEFSSAIDWLTTAGLAYKIPIVEHAEIPLKVHFVENNFKLYFLDVGLLGALSDLPLRAFMQEGSMFKTFKGAFTENFFLQEFRANRSEPLCSWTGKTSELDFLFQGKELLELWPIEIKSGESGKLKSLNIFFEKYSPPWKTRCNLAPLEINRQSNFRNIPLYLSSKC